MIHNLMFGILIIFLKTFGHKTFLYLSTCSIGHTSSVIFFLISDFLEQSLKDNNYQ